MDDGVYPISSDTNSTDSPSVKQRRITEIFLVFLFYDIQTAVIVSASKTAYLPQRGHLYELLPCAPLYISAFSFGQQGNGIIPLTSFSISVVIFVDNHLQKSVTDAGSRFHKRDYLGANIQGSTLQSQNVFKIFLRKIYPIIMKSLHQLSCA